MNITINSQEISDYMQIVKVQLISLAFMALSGAAAVESHEEAHARSPCGSSKCKYLLKSGKGSATNTGDDVSTELKAPALDNEERKHTEECCVKKGGCRCRDARNECAEQCGEEDGQNACKEKGVECPEDCGKGVRASACNNKGMENLPSRSPESVQQVSRAPEPVLEDANKDSAVEERKETSSDAREDRIVGKEEKGDPDSKNHAECNTRSSFKKERCNPFITLGNEINEAFIRSESKLPPNCTCNFNSTFSCAEEGQEKKGDTPKHQKPGSSDVDGKKESEVALSGPQHAPGTHVCAGVAGIDKDQTVSYSSGDSEEKNASDSSCSSEEEEHNGSGSGSCDEGESKKKTVMDKMFQACFGRNGMQLKGRLTEQDRPNGCFTIDGYLLEGERPVVTAFAVKAMPPGKAFEQNSG